MLIKFCFICIKGCRCDSVVDPNPYVFGLQDPDPSLFVGTHPDPSIIKQKRNKNLDFLCFVTPF
jgi:hypothetical protein